MTRDGLLGRGRGIDGAKEGGTILVPLARPLIWLVGRDIPSELALANLA